MEWIYKPQKVPAHSVASWGLRGDSICVCMPVSTQHIHKHNGMQQNEDQAAAVKNPRSSITR